MNLFTTIAAGFKEVWAHKFRSLLTMLGIILGVDRILDMTQTALNVLGDMIAAVHPDRKRLRYVRAKNIKRIREERLKKEGPKAAPLPVAAPVTVNKTAAGGPKP